MDSTLEEEIARLSRPPKAEQAEPLPSQPSSGVILHPQNGAAAQKQRQMQKQGMDGSMPVPPGPARLRRGSSGSSSGELSRTGSGGRLGSGGGLRSPEAAAAVLAGRSISDLQLPIVPPGSGSPPQSHRLGGGSGGLATNGRPRPRLPANGEKVAGPRPAANGERVMGPAGAKSRPLAVSAGMGGSGGAGSVMAVPVSKKSPSKDEEAWRKSEEALKKKEQSVRSALRAKQRIVQQESMLLATVDKELAQLALNHQTEINELRKTLEVVDRELAFLDRDAQRKLEAFEKARSQLSSKVTEKQGVTSRLTELIMASEKQRDAKLNEIMKKMSTEQGEGGSGGGGGGGGGASYPN